MKNIDFRKKKLGCLVVGMLAIVGSNQLFASNYLSAKSVSLSSSLNKGYSMLFFKDSTSTTPITNFDNITTQNNSQTAYGRLYSLSPGFKPATDVTFSFLQMYVGLNQKTSGCSGLTPSSKNCAITVSYNFASKPLSEDITGDGVSASGNPYGVNGILGFTIKSGSVTQGQLFFSKDKKTSFSATAISTKASDDNVALTPYFSYGGALQPATYTVTLSLKGNEDKHAGVFAGSCNFTIPKDASAGQMYECIPTGGSPLMFTPYKFGSYDVKVSVTGGNASTAYQQTQALTDNNSTLVMGLTDVSTNAGTLPRMALVVGKNIAQTLSKTDDTFSTNASTLQLPKGDQSNTLGISAITADMYNGNALIASGNDIFSIKIPLDGSAMDASSFTTLLTTGKVDQNINTLGLGVVKNVGNSATVGIVASDNLGSIYYNNDITTSNFKRMSLPSIYNLTNVFIDTDSLGGTGTFSGTTTGQVVNIKLNGSDHSPTIDVFKNPNVSIEPFTNVMVSNARVYEGIVDPLTYAYSFYSYNTTDQSFDLVKLNNLNLSKDENITAMNMGGSLGALTDVLYLGTTKGNLYTCTVTAGQSSATCSQVTVKNPDTEAVDQLLPFNNNQDLLVTYDDLKISKCKVASGVVTCDGDLNASYANAAKAVSSDNFMQTDATLIVPGMNISSNS